MPTTNHLIKNRSITKSLLVYLICPLACDSARRCSFTIQQGLQVSPPQNSQQMCFVWKSQKKRKGDFSRQKKDEREHSDSRPGISWCIESNRSLYLCKRAVIPHFPAISFFFCLFTWGTKRRFQIYGDHSAEVLQLRINPPILWRGGGSLMPCGLCYCLFLWKRTSTSEIKPVLLLIVCSDNPSVYMWPWGEW